MINKYWDLNTIALNEQTDAEGDLIAYGTPTKPKPGDPILA